MCLQGTEVQLRSLEDQAKRASKKYNKKQSTVKYVGLKA